MTKKQLILLGLILLLGAILIFFRLTRPDMLGDDAHYAFRSIGYFDYMASEEQTTPVQWFGERPLWSFLSFHDHPPLVFFIQHIFFRIFGVSVLVARLPSALAALGTVLVLFFLVKRLAGLRAGLFSAAALAVNNYFVWTGRLGLLESVFLFFTLLGFLFLVKGLQESRNFVWPGLFFGLASLSKYTLLFILPAVLIYLLWRERQVFRNKHFWLGISVFFLVCLPTIIYNLNLYETRGHFDVQLADLFGQTNKDWPKISDRVTGMRLAPLGVIQVLLDGFSWPYFGLFVFALLGNFYFASKKGQALTYLPVFIVFSLFVFFSLIGNASRWLGVVSPFVAWIIGLSLAEFGKNKLVLGLAILVGAASLFYLVNTNHLLKPVGSKAFFADFRVENYGYNQLDKEISKLVSGRHVPSTVREAVTWWWYKNFSESVSFASITNGAEPFNALIIYDSNTNWFPTLWTFERWKLYHRIFIATSEEYLKIVRSQADLEVLRSLNLDGIYYIGSSAAVAAASGINFSESEFFVQSYKLQDIEPKIVYDDQRREAFYLYYGSFK